MATATVTQDRHGADRRILYAAIVIVVGVLGTTLAQPQVLGRIPIQNLLKNELHVDRAANAAFFLPAVIVNTRDAQGANTEVELSAAPARAIQE
jgi:hypothetical protein